MPATKPTQKGTAMDYLSAPRESGIVKSIMTQLGFTAPKGGRLPAGVKLDTLVALDEALGVSDFADCVSALSSRIATLQASRRVSTAKISATPEAIIASVQAGKISLADLKAKILELEAETS